eukprot:5053981-Amphidinium_carterae.1
MGLSASLRAAHQSSRGVFLVWNWRWSLSGKKELGRCVRTRGGCCICFAVLVNEISCNYVEEAVLVGVASF